MKKKPTDIEKWQEVQRKGMLKYQSSQRKKNLEKLKNGTLYMKPKKKPEETIKYWKKRAWDAFSLFIRSRDADEYGYCHCISCGARLHWRQQAQAGHFMQKGRGNALWFKEDNVYVQCFKCNITLEGNQYEYALALDKKFGEGTAMALKRFKDTSATIKTTFTIPQLQEMEKIYTDKYRENIINKGLEL